MRILVSGKNSQIGQKLFFYTKDSSHNFYFLDSNGNCEQMEGKASAKEYYEILRTLDAVF